LTTSAKLLRRQLTESGLSRSIIDAAWPEWWTDEADSSKSARTELRFSLARKLGLEPRSLLDEGAPKFIWRDEAKFKNLSAEGESERAALTSFGMSIGREIVPAPNTATNLIGTSASDIRASILKNQPYVRLIDLLGLCWGVGIPVVFLKVFPLSAKKMCAMTIRVNDQFAILLGKESQYPATVAYYIAHELGHVALGHLSGATALIDYGDPLDGNETDEEELEADRYALELLTGSTSPSVVSSAESFTASQLADSVLRASSELGIEPGTLALCYGHSSGDWAKVNAAFSKIYTEKKPVWNEVNRIAALNLEWGTITDDSQCYLKAIMGGAID
jgi:hypothetical protein